MLDISNDASMKKSVFENPRVYLELRNRLCHAAEIMQESITSNFKLDKGLFQYILSKESDICDTNAKLNLELLFTLIKLLWNKNQSGKSNASFLNFLKMIENWCNASDEEANDNVEQSISETNTNSCYESDGTGFP